VKYKNNADGLTQILKQKYVAFFQIWIRSTSSTNVVQVSIPTFLIYQVQGGTKIPKRFQYPQSEFTTNKTNVEAALKRPTTDGKDDINYDFWIC
jgi:hypothetical protein